MGEPERIQYRGIGVTSVDYANDSSVREELNKVRKRMDKGESFETIAKDYSDRKGYRAGIGHQLNDWVHTKIFKKQGLDALTPGSLLKGKTVLVKVEELHVVMVMKIEDYHPDTQMSIEDAVNDEHFRQIVIRKAQGYKFMIQKRDLIKELKNKAGGVKYRGNKDEIFQRMANQYKEFRTETRKNDPNSIQ